MTITFAWAGPDRTEVKAFRPTVSLLWKASLASRVNTWTWPARIDSGDASTSVLAIVFSSLAFTASFHGLPADMNRHVIKRVRGVGTLFKFSQTFFSQLSAKHWRFGAGYVRNPKIMCYLEDRWRHAAQTHCISQQESA